MKINIKKIKFIILLVICISLMFSFVLYAYWGKTERGGIYWVNSDNTFPRGEWKLIDEDGDGIGYYYYFNENGFILLDDITPDYMIVNKDGRRVDYDGNEVAVKIEDIKMEDGAEEIFSEEILAQIKANQDTSIVNKGVISSGQSIISVDKTETDGPKPSDNLVIDSNPDGTARWILGPNVKLKKEADSTYDPTISRNMQDYVKSGSKYSKKVNGTTFLKGKWKNVMELKGTGATMVFENPKNNFNKLKGRIATHYFSYTDRTTQCTLYIYSEDDGEELMNTSNFNYNGGCTFECQFPKKTTALRFELEVEGQYTSRVCYLRDCQYGFDKEAYEEELYDDEVEAEYRARYGTESDAEYIDEDEEEEYNPLGEVPLEGEDPGARYRRINGLSDELTWFDYDEEDDSVTEAMRASLSELKKKMEEDDEKRNKVSGPAFDEDLKKETQAIGPSGFSNVVAGHLDGEGD